MQLALNKETVLPQGGCAGTLIGRAWLPGDGGPGGPAVVALVNNHVFDISSDVATSSELMNVEAPVATVAEADKTIMIGALDELLANSVTARRDPSKPWFLSPIDTQAIKAAGVTFVDSLIERVVEELATGDPRRAESIRATIADEIGAELLDIRPGSAQAERLKASLMARDLWSPYLEVGIGPYAEIFTKAQPLSSVGVGADIGIPAFSLWSNPEPEAVLVVSAHGRIVGATLGNDVNLRDIEGRSALLLGKAKDNNASCAIGPFIRLFDSTFTLNDLRQMEISLNVTGDDRFSMAGTSNLRRISRNFEELVAQTIHEAHQYPDGFVLMTGTMFVPVDDRKTPGQGFTHEPGDIVTIASPLLGALINRVDHCENIEPWTMGITALMRNLSSRGLI